MKVVILQRFLDNKTWYVPDPAEPPVEVPDEKGRQWCYKKLTRPYVEPESPAEEAVDEENEEGEDDGQEEAQDSGGIHLAEPEDATRKTASAAKGKPGPRAGSKKKARK